MKQFIQHIVRRLKSVVGRQQSSISSQKLEIKNLLLTAFCLLLYCQLATAQRFPVQVNQSIIPPYSTKLNSYVTSSDVKLRLYLTMTDVTISNRQVRLKLKIKGNGINIQSADFVTGAPFIFLNGGTQQQFTNLDLAAYFQLNNLEGINPQQYTQPLPDGTYKICWEVYDFRTNQLISNANIGCSNIFLLLNDPPFLNLPNRGDQLTDIQPTNIIFQWTPRHANATNVSYEFELRELWDNQIDPQAGFLASPPYHTETTFSTTVLYNISKPQLFSGRTYAWRVRAKSTTGLSENAVFRNNGYSEIFYFTYTNQCYPPTFSLAEPLNSGRVNLSWQTHPDHNKYHVQYKRADVPGAEWFELFSYNNQVQIANLQDGITYDFRVGGTCHQLTDFNQAYSYSSMNQFTMPTADETVTYSCGIVPEIEITNTNPLGNIGVNETFTAGDFPVTVKQIQGGNGMFSGTGFIVVPYLADTKIAVEFSGIKINTDYQLYDGIIKTTYDPTWSSVEDVGDIFNGGDGQVNISEVDFPIGEILIDPNGDILIVGEGGAPVVELPGGEDYIITYGGDPNSDPPRPSQTWAVDEEGNVTKLGEQAEGGNSTPQNTNGVNTNGETTSISAQGVEVTFTKATATKYPNKYGFDAYNPSYSVTKDLYKKLGSNYYMPYKAVAKGQTDYIIANLSISNDSIKPEDIIFKTKDGVAIKKVASTSTSITLELKGTLSDANVETQAVIKQGDKYQIAGAFIQYQATSKNIDIVFVNTANTNTQNIKDRLKEIYQQALVTFTITEIDDFDINAHVSSNTIESGESGFLANYTSQQQSINSALKSRPDYNQSTYYIILTDKTPSTAGEKGLMPIGRQFGYIYDIDAKTIAHELGHGAFQLKHPFSTHSYGWNANATNWLMDYSSGEHLPYPQWENIHNPSLRIGIFDGDKEGEFAYYLVAPNFRVMQIPDSISNGIYNLQFSSIPTGTLPGLIKIKNKETYTNYTWNSTNNNYQNTDNPKDTESPIFLDFEKINVKNKISLFYNLSSQCDDWRQLVVEYGDIKNALILKDSEGLLEIINANKTKAVSMPCYGIEEEKQNTGKWHAVRGNSIICSEENIQSSILNALNNINQIKNDSKPEYVKNMMQVNHSTCVFESISIEKRIQILDILLGENVDDSNWQFETDNYGLLDDNLYLDKLILSTPEKDRLALLKEFTKNDYRWMEVLWSETFPGILNDDVALPEIVTLISILSDWVGKYYNELNIEISLKTQEIYDIDTNKFVSISYPKSYLPILLGANESVYPLDRNCNINENFETKLAYNSDPKYSEGFINFKQNSRQVLDKSPIIYDANGKAPYKYRYYNYNESFRPFEPVRVLANKDYYFLDLQTNNKVTEIVVPAMLAALYQQLILNNEKQYKLKQFTNGLTMVAAIAAIPYTGGTSYLAFASSMAIGGGGLAVIDIGSSAYMNSIKDNPTLYNEYAEAYQMWSEIYSTYQLLEGAGAIPLLTTSLAKVNLLEKCGDFTKKIKALPDEIKTGSSTIKNELKSNWNLLTEASDLANAGDGVPTRLIEGKNIFRASSQEYSLAKKLFKEYRQGVIYEQSRILSGDDLTAFKNEFNGKNIAKVEGKIDDVALDNGFRRSGDEFDDSPIFDVYKVDRQGNIDVDGAWIREWDTEYVMLSEIAKSKGAVKGGVYPKVKGEIIISSELPYCVSCQGVIQDFSDMFPNLDVILIDGLR